MDTQDSRNLNIDRAAMPVQLREICGNDELSTLSAHSLALDLTLNPGQLPRELSLSSIDHILADIYRSIYGETIECFAHCNQCGKSFEMSFKLSDWLASLKNNSIDALTAFEDGTFELQDENGKVVFRLPTESDLHALAGFTDASAEQALRTRCVLDGNPDHVGLDEAMMQAGPLLDGPIEATCAYCEASQMVDFCLADYLMSILERERPLVIREIHCIARAYSWSRAEILAMPRFVRQEHVRLVLAERAQEEDTWA